MVFTVDRQLFGEPKEKYWITYIKSRIKKNKNFICFVSGQTGSGKSWSSISIGESLDPDFGIDRIVFSGIELMNLINSGKLKGGSVIIFEEVGVEHSNKNWQSITNKMLSYLMQTFRHRCFVLIMNSPYMDFLEASTRKLVHAELQCLSIDLDNNVCKIKPQLLQYNSRKKKFYYKRLKVCKADGKYPIDIWKVDKPSTELIKAYEQKKTNYTDNLNLTILNALQQVEDKNNKKGVKKDDPIKLTDVQQEVLDLLKSGLKPKEIAIKRERNVTVINETMRQLRHKGFKIKPLYKEGRIIGYKINDFVRNNDEGSVLRVNEEL
jgi:tRNA splicing endonuclease